LAAQYLGKRLREAKKNGEGTNDGVGKQKSSEKPCFCLCSSEELSQLDSLNTFCLVPFAGDYDYASPQPSQSVIINPSYLQQSNPLSYELPYEQTVIKALYINGDLLGLSCGTPLVAKSQPATPDMPVALHPTPAQIAIPHNIGFDRFPFPRMRDNAITFSSIIDVDDFMRDLFTQCCFTIRSGGAPWDPTAWRAEKPFAVKWAFLLS
jgi:hypothetical protein